MSNQPTAPKGPLQPKAPTKTGSVSCSVSEGFPILSISGYFDEEVGIKINQQADDSLRSGKVWLIVDFTNCVAVNSLGVGYLLELTLKVVEDFQGRLVLVNINRLMHRVFELGGITPPAEMVADIAQGVALLKSVG